MPTPARRGETLIMICVMLIARALLLRRMQDEGFVDEFGNPIDTSSMLPPAQDIYEKGRPPPDLIPPWAPPPSPGRAPPVAVAPPPPSLRYRYRHPIRSERSSAPLPTPNPFERSICTATDTQSV